MDEDKLPFFSQVVEMPEKETICSVYIRVETFVSAAHWLKIPSVQKVE
jgi:hypothetical protein